MLPVNTQFDAGKPGIVPDIVGYVVNPRKREAEAVPSTATTAFQASSIVQSRLVQLPLKTGVQAAAQRDPRMLMLHQT